MTRAPLGSVEVESDCPRIAELHFKIDATAHVNGTQLVSTTGPTQLPWGIECLRILYIYMARIGFDHVSSTIINRA